MINAGISDLPFYGCEYLFSACECFSVTGVQDQLKQIVIEVYAAMAKADQNRQQ